MECLLLHGWGTKQSVWNKLIVRLKGFESIDAPCLYQVARQTNDYEFKSIATELSDSISNDCVVISWSIGGLIAMPLQQLSKNIKAIILIASAPCFVNKGEWSNVIDEKGIRALKLKLNKNTTDALDYFSGLIAHGDKKPKDMMKQLREHMADERDNEILSSWLDQMITTDQRNCFSEIDCPVKMILAENDSLIHSAIETDLKLLNPNVDICVMEGCGHAPHVSMPEQTSVFIKEFIDAI